MDATTPPPGVPGQSRRRRHATTRRRRLVSDSEFELGVVAVGSDHLDAAHAGYGIPSGVWDLIRTRWALDHSATIRSLRRFGPAVLKAFCSDDQPVPRELRRLVADLHDGETLALGLIGRRLRG